MRSDNLLERSKLVDRVRTLVDEEQRRRLRRQEEEREETEAAQDAQGRQGRVVRPLLRSSQNQQCKLSLSRHLSRRLRHPSRHRHLDQRRSSPQPRPSSMQEGALASLRRVPRQVGPIFSRPPCSDLASQPLLAL